MKQISIRFSVYTAFLIWISVFFFMSLKTESGGQDKLDIFPTYFKTIENAADGKFKKAIPVFNEVLKRFPYHQDATICLKICLDLQDELISRTTAKALFQSINARENHEEESEVLRLFEWVQAYDNKYFLTYLLRGNYLFKKKQYEQASNDYSEAIKLAPEFAISYFNIARIQKVQNKYDLAIKNINICLYLDSLYVPSYIERAGIYYKTGNMDPSLEDFKKARTIDSLSTRTLETGAILNNMGTHYLSLNSDVKAIEALTEAIKADQRWYEPFLNRGIAYKNIKQFTSALEDLNRVLILEPESKEAYYQRARIHMQMDNPDLAEKDFLKVLFLDENNAEVNYALAGIYRSGKDMNKAIIYYQKTIDLEPDRFWAYYRLGMIYDNKKDYKNAVRYYSKFLNQVPEKNYKHKISISNRIKTLQRYLDK